LYINYSVLLVRSRKENQTSYYPCENSMNNSWTVYEHIHGQVHESAWTTNETFFVHKQFMNQDIHEHVHEYNYVH
jgi:hypothetical protein